MAGREIELAIAAVERWCAHVERFGYERTGVGLDASPHMLAAGAKKLAALAKGEPTHG